MKKKKLTFKGTEMSAVRSMASAIPCAYQGYSQNLNRRKESIINAVYSILMLKRENCTQIFINAVYSILMP